MSKPPKQTPKVPKNWPANITYLTTPVYTAVSTPQRRQLQTQPTAPLSEIPPTLSFAPSPHVEIRRIADAAHPACGQHGLFAARRLAPGQFVVPYWGVYHSSSSSGGGRQRHQQHQHQHAASDYDLWLDRAADVAVDAARAGNEARFVNDFRGVPGAARANAEFREVWDPRRGERAVAVFVVRRGGGGGGGGVAKGEELLVSYGKGFWEVRERERQAEKEREAKVAGPPPPGPSGGGSGAVDDAAEALGGMGIGGRPAGS